ncbi:acyl-CoA dehydrogenase [Streptomyces sp. NPDC054940]
MNHVRSGVPDASACRAPAPQGRGRAVVGTPARPPVSAACTTPGAPDRDTASAQVAELEHLLGDPGDPANPHGFEALLAADEARRPPGPTEQLLVSAGLTAEFVPVRHGGRLARADTLARVLRPVFRRDLALGFGLGLPSLFAAGAVWTAGSDRQRADTARLLLGGGRAAIAHHSLAHSNVIYRDEVRATRVPAGFSLTGAKEAVLNADRAGALVVYARTEPAPGPRSHSVLLLEPDALPADRWSRLPRRLTHGMRGCSYTGVDFTGCEVGADTLVGEPGAGVELALRAFQLNRCLVPAAVHAGVDTALRMAVRAATAGRGGSLARRLHTPLTGVLADLLTADCLIRAGLRTLHLVPDGSSVLAAVVKYLVPDLLREAVEELSGVLGARGYHRGGDFGGFEKLVRDLPMAGLGHAGTAACQAVIMPQLRGAARTWTLSNEPPAALFAPEVSLPPLDFTALRPAGGHDALAATLRGASARLAEGAAPAGPTGRALGELADSCARELLVLREQFRTRPAFDRGAPAGPEALAAVDRYALLLAAAACLGVWERQDGRDPFLAGAEWPVLCLGRLVRRLGLPVPELPPECVPRMLDEVLSRFARGRGYDLHGDVLADAAR